MKMSVDSSLLVNGFLLALDVLFWFYPELVGPIFTTFFLMITIMVVIYSISLIVNLRDGSVRGRGEEKPEKVN